MFTWESHVKTYKILQGKGNQIIYLARGREWFDGKVVMRRLRQGFFSSALASSPLEASLLVGLHPGTGPGGSSSNGV